MIDLNRRCHTNKPSLPAVILAPTFHAELERPALLKLGGKSLLAWSLDCAMNAEVISEVLVATDDRQTALAAGRMGRGRKPVQVIEVDGACHGVYPLARVRQSLVKADTSLCVLHVAAPLRASFDVDAAAEMFFETLARRDERRPLTLCSVGSFQHTRSLERLRWVVRDGDFGRRQDGTRAGLARYVYSFGDDKPEVPGVELCTVNEAITLLTPEALAQWQAAPHEGMPGERLAYIMPEERSLEIESERDLRCAMAIAGLRNATTVVAPPLAA